MFEIGISNIFSATEKNNIFYNIIKRKEGEADAV
jgi:hypothetical protein